MTGEEIKKLRIKLGVSQERFGQLLGVTWGTIQRWETGKFKPSHLALEKLKQIQEGDHGTRH